jgi:hypothetical protein
MKTILTIHTASLILLAASASAGAAVRYVNVKSASPTPPYTNWASAAIAIQDAVDVALPGDEVVVTNGVYETGGRAVDGFLTNRVAVMKPLLLRSVNGPGVTMIRGAQVSGSTNGPGAVRCAYLVNGVNLIGFTLEGGATLTNLALDYRDRHLVSGGGIWCESESVTVSNCVIRGNSAVFGGGVCQGTLLNCTLSNNVARRTGGGSLLTALIGCNLSSNSASVGGGARMGTLSECILIGNSAAYGGGAQDANLSHCELRDNVAAEQGGGARGGSLGNCLVVNNTAWDGGGAWGSTVVNCTVVGNTALYGGGVSGNCYSGSGIPGCDSVYISPWGFTDCVSSSAHISSSVIYYNNAPDAPNVTADGRNAFVLIPGSCNFIQFSCTFPLSVLAAGNFTNAPLFLSEAAGDFRLQSSSPCINASRNPYAPVSSDLDGNSRMVGGTVDIGAYEFQSPQSTLSYAWLAQYRLPTDGSADLTDPDSDGQNNWQEWRSWTDPTNSASALRLLAPTVSANGLLVRWQSVSGPTYFLERSIHLGAQPVFAPLASNIAGQAGATVFTDTNAVDAGPFFYRVRLCK